MSLYTCIFARQNYAMKLLNSLCLLLAALTIFSCASKKDILYLQDANGGSSQQAAAYEPTLKPDDLLSIIISAETPEVTVPFNLPAIQGNYEVNNNQNGIKTYLIDSEGYIDFPVVGKIQLGGLTRAQAVSKIAGQVSEYITKPSVNLRILNYKISVLGEVNRPGSFTLASERITLLESLALAGDLTIYGNRKNLLIIRETNGEKSFNRVDITSSDFTNSPYYYLGQNDVVVVEPNKTRVNASAVGPNLTIIISGLSLLLSVAVLIFK